MAQELLLEEKVHSKEFGAGQPQEAQKALNILLKTKIIYFALKQTNKKQCNRCHLTGPYQKLVFLQTGHGICLNTDNKLILSLRMAVVQT